MNCHELDYILDTQDVSDLTPSEQRAIDGHLQSCPACRSAWETFSAIASEQVPPLPAELRQQLAQTVAAQLPARARPKRRAFIGIGVFALGAAAATIAVQIGLREPVSDDNASAPDVGVVEGPAARTVAATGVADAPFDGTGDGDGSGDGRAEPDMTAGTIATDAVESVLDRRSLVIVLDDAGLDQGALAALAECHRGVVERLSALPGLTVIAGEQAAAYKQSGLSNAEIAREFGAGAVLVVDSRFSCRVELADVRTGEFLAGQIADFRIGELSDPAKVDWEYFFSTVARHVNDKLLTDEATLMAEAQARFLDTTLSENDRLAALYRTSAGNSYLNPEIFNVAVIAGLSQIMTTATAVADRTGAVQVVRGSTDPALVEPLLYALTYDPAPAVRAAAASTLHTFFDDARVRDALAQIVAADPQADDAAICCDSSLAQTARRALLSDAELRAATMAHLLNSALPDLDRLYPLVNSLDSRGLDFVFDAAEAQAVFDIGSRSDEPAVRARAWSALSYGGYSDPALVPVLLQDLAGHPDDSVRQAAARALTRHADDPAVRALFERVLAQDPCECVRTTLTQALAADAAEQP